MSPEYLNQLADLADPDQLWRRGNIIECHAAMTDEERQRLDTGVALRRYASHLQNVERALQRQESLLITPLSSSGNAVAIIETPERHQRLRDARNHAISSRPELIIPFERGEDAALRKMGLRPRPLRENK